MPSHWALGSKTATGSSEDLNVKERKEDISVWGTKEERKRSPNYGRRWADVARRKGGQTSQKSSRCPICCL